MRLTKYSFAVGRPLKNRRHLKALANAQPGTWCTRKRNEEMEILNKADDLYILPIYKAICRKIGRTGREHTTLRFDCSVPGPMLRWENTLGEPDYIEPRLSVHHTLGDEDSLILVFTKSDDNYHLLLMAETATPGFYTVLRWYKGCPSLWPPLMAEYVADDLVKVVSAILRLKGEVKKVT
jgi:hypothetical protein